MVRSCWTRASIMSAPAADEDASHAAVESAREMASKRARAAFSAKRQAPTNLSCTSRRYWCPHALQAIRAAAQLRPEGQQLFGAGTIERPYRAKRCRRLHEQHQRRPDGALACWR